MKNLFLVLLILIGINAAYSQSKNPDEILKRVTETFEMIEDYEVDVLINVNVKFLKMPDRKAKIFYKQPDKIFVESEGFALLPKQGLNFSPLTFLQTAHTALIDRVEELNRINTTVIKVIPIGNKSDIILSTLWIDESRNLIMKIESSTKPDGSIVIEFQYSKIDDNFYLPSTIVFTFDVDKVYFPTGITGEMNSESEKKDKKNDIAKQGKVTITYSNYKVNQGLSDELFKKESPN